LTAALRKEPKWFLRDWSIVEDPGARAETLVACHLLKAVEGWTDLGLGRFELRYLRDKAKREVDFLIVRDRKPWVWLKSKWGTRCSRAASLISSPPPKPLTPFKRSSIFPTWTPIVSAVPHRRWYRRGLY